MGCDGRTSPSAMVARTNGVCADGEVVWSWRSDAGAKVVKTLSRLTGDGGNQAWSPGRSRISRKTIAQGRPDDPPVPVVLPRAFCCTRTMGAVGTRPSLRPLLFRGRNENNSSDAICAARMRGHAGHSGMVRSTRPQMRNCASGNLEIPGSMRNLSSGAHSRDPVASPRNDGRKFQSPLARNDGFCWSNVMRSVQHPLAVGAVERKGRHVDLEVFAGFADHLIAAGHNTRRGRKQDAGGIFETLAGREHRLFADHAFALDVLPQAGGVDDDPVPRLQLHGLVAIIGDDNGIGPEIAGLLRRRTVRHEVRFDGHFDLACHGAVHPVIIAKSSAGTNLAARFQHSSRLEPRRCALTLRDLPASRRPIHSFSSWAGGSRRPRYGAR